ncbi:laccase [Sistotremastrum niveocremeum HHB9708]|uniref:Laccase n=2 Tax=Sistotremastraceae TaxID=3402574 RepID=A0A164MD81_9AGAM|nr:laccase [Sistotremastrum niveocremeum HHB9708]KZT39421.1 laccase [Sistotremastrum suecicum HHB10207 ss-3]
MHLTHSLSFLLSFVTTVFAGTTFKTLTVTDATISPDGFSRTAIVTNGQYPAPLITANKGDNFVLTVNNHLSDPSIRESTSIHWHGLFQHRTTANDGVAMVSQCPIAPGHSFTYRFGGGGQAGSFWYHSHLSTQYCDGLRGPLVIYDPFDPQRHLYDFDDASTVITIGDWYHQTAETAFADPTIIAPTPDSVVINGKARYAGGPNTPLSVIGPVIHGKRYRFRLINISCLTYFTIQLDGHTMTVIEADGQAHQPYNVDSLVIFPGQRYSVIVTANQAIGNYWFRATPSPQISNFASSTDPGLNNAVFRYFGASNTEPTTTQATSTNPLVEASMVPLVNPGAPGGSNPPDVALNLVIGLTLPMWTVNGFSFTPPSVPVLLQILSGTTAAQDLLPAGDVYTLPPNAVVEISIPDAGAITRAHPFHLHGHAFDIVRSGGQTDYNYINPPRRDVVAIHDGNVTFRFKTDNAGPWLLHCHIDWHFSQGLAIVLAEDPAGIESGPNSAILPPGYNDLCDIYNALPESEQ